MERNSLGKIQVYTGPGRGKSSAALGLALRMLGAGGRVGLFAFMKDDAAAEYCALARYFPDLEYRCSDEIRQPFFHLQTEEQKQRSIKRYRTLWQNFWQTLLSDSFHLFILDEISYVLNLSIISEEEMGQLFRLCRRQRIELILTGRAMPAYIVEQADLVSAIDEIRHPMRQGLSARRGIDY